jgi:8-amino-7-oxononanoate synthase
VNPASVLDFTSALYLGLRHESWILPPWPQLTRGIPAALGEPPGAREVAAKLAALQGCDAATLGTSTLHLFWDLFGMLACKGVAIYVDDGSYSIMRWGAERAAASGVPLHTFRHHGVDGLRRRLHRDAFRRLLPVVAADGFCPNCGKPTPIGAYLQAVRELGGCLVLDDTQALGILGRAPDGCAPYGRSGGGSLRHANIGGADVVLVSSLAKGFGVPLAVLSGSKVMVRSFESRSETRVHCSPPSVAVIHAAEHALAANENCGDELRLRLVKRVAQFRNRLGEIGLAAPGGLFPVQTLAPIRGLDAAALYCRLLRLGVRTVLRRARSSADPWISFLITANHTPDEIDRAAEALASVVKRVDSPLPSAASMVLR